MMERMVNIMMFILWRYLKYLRHTTHFSLTQDNLTQFRDTIEMCGRVCQVESIFQKIFFAWNSNLKGNCRHFRVSHANEYGTRCSVR